MVIIPPMSGFNAQRFSMYFSAIIDLESTAGLQCSDSLFSEIWRMVINGRVMTKEVCKFCPKIYPVGVIGVHTHTFHVGGVVTSKYPQYTQTARILSHQQEKLNNNWFHSKTRMQNSSLWMSIFICWWLVTFFNNWVPCKRFNRQNNN